MKLIPSLIATTALLAGPAMANGQGPAGTYAVTVTNLTKTQNFTPLIAASHAPDIAFFQPGEPAIEPIAILAESGSPAALESLLQSVPDLVLDTAINGALLGPGESVTLYVEGHPAYDHLSLAAMLIPTNDTFVAMNSLPLPNQSTSVFAYAWDAGSEDNDELCASIPGPPCFGEALSEADGEGFVHLANGIQGVGDVDAAAYDWNGPVARVSIRRMR